MSAEVERESIEATVEQENLALKEYRNFLPSKIKKDIWSSKFLLFVERPIGFF